MMIFGSAWLALFRCEYVFQQAALIIPAGMVAMFLANTVRIAALILIGAAGAEQVALGGVHSQAGWICFNILTLVFSGSSNQLPWVGANQSRSARTCTFCTENAAAAYVLPFMAILATGVMLRTISAEFEWLPAVPFVIALAILWFFRRTNKCLDWTFAWAAPIAGNAAFLM